MIDSNEKNLGGRPKIFETPKEMQRCFDLYIDYCEVEKQLPNIAGFMVFVRRLDDKYSTLNRETFYRYKNYPEYSHTTKDIDEGLENAALNCTYQPPLIRLAYLNNKSGYTNKTESVSLNINAELTESEADRILISAGIRLSDNDDDLVLID